VANFTGLLSAMANNNIRELLAEASESGSQLRQQAAREVR
jgi:hypothetical protein